MLILEAYNIKKFHGDRLILGIDELKVYDCDRIGIVGCNGSGKTTLINILTGNEPPDEGTVRLYGDFAHITQLDSYYSEETNPVISKRLGISDKNPETLSGGEKTRAKIAQSLGSPCSILFADEPTCSLDIKGTEMLEEFLSAFRGALVIVSHDRTLLDTLCTEILEIENGSVTGYSGNYSDYKAQKDAKIQRKEQEYLNYIEEKKRLEASIAEKKQSARAVKKAPSRMGNSEARLHKRMSGQTKAKLERAAKSIETRLSQLEKKEKPAKTPRVRMDMGEHRLLYCKTVISGKNLYKFFGSRVILDGVNFRIENGRKVALVGDNGSGKTTLLNMIMAGEQGIETARGARIGYFSQNLANLDLEKTILENVLEVSVHPLSHIRLTLAQLLFRRDEVNKKVKLLSGGEKVKAALAKILLSDNNFIIMDEPTNYLDIQSLEALEKLIRDFPGTVLFVSHDRAFVERVADEIIILSKGKLFQYKGSYAEYTEHVQTPKPLPSEDTGEILRLENRLTEIVGLICLSKGEEKAKLDKEYLSILEKLKSIRARILL